NAARAAATASSTSSPEASGTVAPPTRWVRPDLPSVNRPPTNIRYVPVAAGPAELASDRKVRLQPVPVSRPPVPGVPAGRRGRVGPVGRVRPHDACPHPVGDREHPGPVAAPDPGGRAVPAVAGQGHRLVRGTERQHWQHRTRYGR